jgi:hypothetical protein
MSSRFFDEHASVDDRTSDCDDVVDEEEEEEDEEEEAAQLDVEEDEVGNNPFESDVDETENIAGVINDHDHDTAVATNHARVNHAIEMEEEAEDDQDATVQEFASRVGKGKTAVVALVREKNTKKKAVSKLEKIRHDYRSKQATLRFPATPSASSSSGTTTDLTSSDTESTETKRLVAAYASKLASEKAELTARRKQQQQHHQYQGEDLDDMTDYTSPHRVVSSTPSRTTAPKRDPPAKQTAAARQPAPLPHRSGKSKSGFPSAGDRFDYKRVRWVVIAAGQECPYDENGKVDISAVTSSHYFSCRCIESNESKLYKDGDEQTFLMHPKHEPFAISQRNGKTIEAHLKKEERERRFNLAVGGQTNNKYSNGAHIIPMSYFNYVTRKTKPKSATNKKEEEEEEDGDETEEEKKPNKKKRKPPVAAASESDSDETEDDDEADQKKKKKASKRKSKKEPDTAAAAAAAAAPVQFIDSTIRDAMMSALRTSLNSGISGEQIFKHVRDHLERWTGWKADTPMRTYDAARVSKSADLVDLYVFATYDEEARKLVNHYLNHVMARNASDEKQ